MLPGGLAYESFHDYCRAGGLDATRKETDRMRDVWMDTFVEIYPHMSIKPDAGVGKYAARCLYTGVPADITADDECAEEEAAGSSGLMYKAVTLTGFRRTRCSKTSAANIQFQGPGCEGAKLAGWELLLAGYADRLINYIHDEYNYWLWPKEVREEIPKIERLMLEGMAKILPDIKVGVESSCCLHWDKGAKTYASLEWDDNGCPILEEPEFVTDVLAGKYGSV